jgi:putative ABC transport system permease protein
MIFNYIKIALRNLKRNKVYSFINIAGLSIGLACCMLIILYNKDEVSYDRFHKNAANIYRITIKRLDLQGKITGTNGITGMMPGPTFKRDIPEIKDFIRVQSERLPVKIGTDIFEQDGIYADDNFFSVFSFPLLAGNPKQALLDIHSIVLSDEVAKKFFGKTNAMGKTLELPLGDKRSFETFTVSGIVPKSPQNSSLKLSMVLPMKLNERNGGGDKEWINFYLNTFVVLNPGANISAIEDKFKKVYETDAKEQIRDAIAKYNMKESFIYGLQPLLDIHLSTAYQSVNGLTDASNPVYAKILSAIAAFILIIACINFVNLTIARSLKRAKEIGIRKVIGGERGQMIMQFLGESYLLTLAAFLLAILLVVLALPVFNHLSNKALSFSYLLDTKLILGYFILFLITGFLAGFYPALVISRFDPAETLYNRLRFSGKNFLAKGLVVLQFTLATFLIIATLTIYSQFNFLTNQDLGYNDKNIVTVPTARMKKDKLNIFREELLKNPSVLKVSARQRGFWSTIAKAGGKDMDFTIEVVDAGYLGTYEIPLVRGRNFSPDLATDSTKSILVNESFVKSAGWKDGIGEVVDFFYDNRKYNVVGVVRDYHYETLVQKIAPQLFIMDPQYDYGLLIIKIKPENSSATLKHIESVFKKNQPFEPYQYQFKDDENVKQYEAENKWKQIISFAAMITIFISCIGLFGLATLAAEKRTKEIGIRKVLGASAKEMIRLLSADFLKLTILAAIIAIPVAWWAMNKWLENYPYRIRMSPGLFAMATLMVVAIALMTVSFQAVKAAGANPAKSLRTE